VELSLDPATTALVMVDLQNGIARDTAPHEPGDVIRRAAAIARSLRSAGGTVVWICVDNHPDGRDRLRPITDSPAAERPRVADHAELAPGLEREPSDLVITKRGWSAFHGTELDLQLRRRGVSMIVLGGISTNVGVETTARSAYDHGYQQVFVEDAMSARTTEDHAWTVKRVLPRMGRVRTAAEVLAALELGMETGSRRSPRGERRPLSQEGPRSGQEVQHA
jgi:nicotinamidase-related amidase